MTTTKEIAFLSGVSDASRGVSGTGHHPKTKDLPCAVWSK